MNEPLAPLLVPRFVTEDWDLFLPTDPANLVLAWGELKADLTLVMKGFDLLFLATHKDALEQLLKRPDDK